MDFKTISEIEDVATMMEVMARKIQAHDGVINRDDGKRIAKFLSTGTEILRFLIDADMICEPEPSMN